MISFALAFNESTLKRIVLLVGTLLSSVLLRVELFHHLSPDVKTFVEPWFLVTQGKGFIEVFSQDFYNYNPPYIYLLWLIAKLGFEPLLSIKILSAVIEVFCALCGALVIRELCIGKGILGFCVLLLCPSMILNGSMWGQVDALYTSFILLSLLFLIRNCKYLSFIVYGAACSIKAQALFVVPAFLSCWIVGVFTLSEIILGTVVFFIVFLFSIMPVWLTGRQIGELLLIYPRQFGEHGDSLSLGAPNMWQWIRNDAVLTFRAFGLQLTSAIMFVWCLSSYRRVVKDRKQFLLSSFFVSALAVPFFLPRMHERYFFVADLLSVVIAFVHPAYCWIALCVNFASWYAYMDWTWGIRPFDWQLIPFVNLAALVGGLRLWLKSFAVIDVQKN
jgi:Gpi18-like mannosyltransferase